MFSKSVKLLILDFLGRSLGAPWGALGELLGSFLSQGVLRTTKIGFRAPASGPSWGQFGACWLQVASSWDQVGSMLPQVGPKLAPKSTPRGSGRPSKHPKEGSRASKRLPKRLQEAFHEASTAFQEASTRPQ